MIKLPGMRLTHRQIEVFRTLMLSGSMTEAARLLSVTQPAVSKIMGQLQIEIGFSLFDSKQGKLSPTDDAYSLYSEVEKSYNGLERVVRTASRIKNRSGGNLRLAVLPTFATGFLVQVVRRLYENVNDIQLSIQLYSSDEIVDLVTSGLCDIGFAMTPVNSSGVQVGPVMSVPSFCILPPHHPLMEKDIVSISDFEGEDFIATAEGTSSRLRTDALFTSMNVSRNIQIDARWSLTISELVAAGLGCSIVDGFTAATFAKRGGIVRPLKERLEFTFVSVAPQSGKRSGMLREFFKIFEDEFQKFHAELLANKFGK